MTQIEVQKAVAYAAELPAAEIHARKVVAYVAELPLQYLEIGKAVAYVVELPDTTGAAWQPTAGDRPIYRAGARPYIEFGAGDSLQVTLLNGGTYTLATLTDAGEFTTQALTLSSGAYTLPAVNFNQAVIVPAALSTVAKESLRQSMLARVQPSLTAVGVSADPPTVGSPALS